MPTDSIPVTWIRVEKPVFDLAGVVLGALGLAGALAALAFVLGTTLGVLLIRRNRSQQDEFVALGLGERS